MWPIFVVVCFVIFLGWIFSEKINPKSSISRKEIEKKDPSFFKDFDNIYSKIK